MINTNFKSILDLIKAFPDEQTCINHLEQLRWNSNVVSPFDSSSIVYKCKDNKYRCKNTSKYFNVKTNTLFDNTKIKLQKWFLAIYIVTSHKKGISSLQLSKDIDVTQKTAWFMLQRIRNCFGINDNDKLNNEVEIDETYIGGKIQNMTTSKRNKMHSKGFKTIMEYKTPVLGMIERKGNIKAMKLNRAYGKEIKPILFSKIDEKSTVITDGYGAYKDIDLVFSKHVKIEHSKGEYAIGRFHTNTIEGFWSILKRGILGIYHFTSKKHLQKYVDEFVFRYNTRSESTACRFNLMLVNCENRLTYKKLING